MYFGSVSFYDLVFDLDYLGAKCLNSNNCGSNRKKEGKRGLPGCVCAVT